MNSGENLAIRALLQVIPPEFTPSAQENTVQIKAGNNSWSLRPIWIGEGFPADAKRVLYEAMHTQLSPQSIPVIVARRIAPGARQLLNDAHLSWADMSGRAQIVVPDAIYITRLEPIPVDARRAFAWSAATSTIAETLLSQLLRDQNSTIDKVELVAAATGISVAHTARVLRQFDEQRYTTKSGAERGSSATREFNDPGRMLSDWAGNYSMQATIPAAEYHVPWRDHARSVEALSQSLQAGNWMLTGEAAADAIAPYLTTISTVDIYVPQREIGAASARLDFTDGFSSTNRGGRVRVFTEADYLFKLSDPSAQNPLASPVRVYGDLLRQQGRVAEAAAMLRETAIGF